LSAALPYDPAVHPLFAKGLGEFRVGRFFEAHEEWETLWAQSTGDVKVFLQALIQIAAACVHLTRGNAAPGIRLLGLADEKLARVGPEFGEIKTDFLRKEIGRALEQLGGGSAPGDVAKALQL
jgi:predicted metal-dependent hydrolase